MSLDDSFAIDPEIDTAIGKFTSELNTLISIKTGGLFDHILDTVAFSDFSIPNKPPLQESPFGNFVTDAMRLVTWEKTGERVDFALQANGSIRGGITPGTMEHSLGKISFYDLTELISLGVGPDAYAGYPIASVYLTGEEIYRILEVAVLLMETMGDTYFLQFSGLRYDYNPTNTILFTVPVIKQPIPTVILPGNFGAVVRAERYTGYGVQSLDDADYVPLKRGDKKLYRLVTDAFILSFLPMVGDMLPTLEIEPKDQYGNPVPLEQLNDLIVRIDDKELKVWQTVVEYAASQEPNDAGIPQIDSYYADTRGRINPVWSFPIITLPILVLLVLVALIILLVRRWWRRRMAILKRT